MRRRSPIRRSRGTRAAADQGRIAVAFVAAIGLRVQYALPARKPGMPAGSCRRWRRSGPGILRRASRSDAPVHDDDERRMMRQGRNEDEEDGVYGLRAIALGSYLRRTSADAQTPKRGGTLQLRHQRRDAALRSAMPATPTRRCISRRRSTRRCCVQSRRSIPEIEGDLAAVLAGRARPDDLHIQAASEREIPRRHADDLRRHQGDLRSPAQSAAGRGVDAARRRSSDIGAIETPDPLTVVFKMKASNASMLEHFASPVELHLLARRTRSRSELPEDQDHRHRPLHASSSTSRAATSPASATTITSRRACPISTASAASSRSRPRRC